MLTTTAGRLAVNAAIPEALRDFDRTWGKAEVTELLKRLASDHPDQYGRVASELVRLGGRMATATGGLSFGLSHLKTSDAALKRRRKLDTELSRLLGDGADPAGLNDRVVHAAGKAMDGQAEEVFQEAKAADNPLAHQVQSGARGNRVNLNSLLGSDMLYADSDGKVIPVPVTRSYSEGLRPWEYFAGSYGARQGVLGTKLGVRAGGALSKVLSRATHRLAVVPDDPDEVDDPENPVGMPADTGDADSAGALLARPAGPYAAGTVLSPKILAHLHGEGVKRVLVHSPVAGGPPSGGIYARQAGVREFGTLPRVGSLPGIAAGQGLSERVAQGALQSKHAGGIAGVGRALSGFDLIDKLVNPPKESPHFAAHAEADGTVGRIWEAAAGGTNVEAGGSVHYAPPGAKVLVKTGDSVEAGDVLSEGTPDPASIVRHKGVGEGRRYLAHALRDAFRESDPSAHRRNAELVARGLVDHVRFTEPFDDWGPDDVAPYSQVLQHWEPRDGHEAKAPSDALGMYLERPVLHHTVGTRVRPSTVKDLEEFGVRKVLAHRDPPPFEPHLVRGIDTLRHDPDWQTRMLGTGLKGGLLDAVHRGLESDEAGTSYVPSLMRGPSFGRVGPLKAAGAVPVPAPPGPPANPVPKPPAPSPAAASPAPSGGVLDSFGGFVRNLGTLTGAYKSHPFGAPSPSHPAPDPNLKNPWQTVEEPSPVGPVRPPPPPEQPPAETPAPPWVTPGQSPASGPNYTGDATGLAPVDPGLFPESPPSPAGESYTETAAPFSSPTSREPVPGGEDEEESLFDTAGVRLHHSPWQAMSAFTRQNLVAPPVMAAGGTLAAVPFLAAARAQARDLGLAWGSKTIPGVASRTAFNAARSINLVPAKPAPALLARAGANAARSLPPVPTGSGWGSLLRQAPLNLLKGAPGTMVAGDLLNNALQYATQTREQREQFAQTQQSGREQMNPLTGAISAFASPITTIGNAPRGVANAIDAGTDLQEANRQGLTVDQRSVNTAANRAQIERLWSGMRDKTLSPNDRQELINLESRRLDTGRAVRQSELERHRQLQDQAREGERWTWEERLRRMPPAEAARLQAERDAAARSSIWGGGLFKSR